MVARCKAFLVKGRIHISRLHSLNREEKKEKKQGQHGGGEKRPGLMVLSVVAGKAKQQCLEIFIIAEPREPRIMWLAIRGRYAIRCGTGRAWRYHRYQ